MTWKFWTREDDPVQVDPCIPETNREMKISSLALGAATSKEAAVDVYSLPAVAPRVIPASAKLAVDSAMTDNYTFAAQSAFSEGLGFVGYPYLAELTQRAEYRRPSEIIADEMTRKWLEFISTGDEDISSKSSKIEAIEAEFDRLKVRDVFRKAVELDGFFGRGQIYIDTGATDKPDELLMPLSDSPSKIGKGMLKGLVPVEPMWTYPNMYNSLDPLKNNFYVPDHWFVLGKQIHASRLMFFVSRPVPDLLKPAYAFGGLSLSQMAKPYVDNWLRTRQSVSDLVASFSTPVLGTNLSTVLNGGQGDNIVTRAQYFNAMRDNRGLMLIDKDTEEFSNVSVPIGSLDKLQAQAQEQMSAVTGIPLVKLFGITPSGLNASSDGEIRVFYDTIAAKQEKEFTPLLIRLLNIVQLSLFGEIDPEISFKWMPLWAMSEVEASTVRKTDADTDAVYVEMGAISPEEVREKIAGDEDSQYPSLDLSVMPDKPDEDDQDEGGKEDNLHGSDAEFEESKHPRAENGEFGSGGTGGTKSNPVQKVSKEEKFNTLISGKSETDRKSFTDAHHDGVAIPPAWTSVSYHGKDGKNGIVAEGVDGKGRKQRLEDPEYRKAKIAEKQERITKNLAPRMPKITKSLRSEAEHGNEASKVLYLITQTGFRIGGAGDGKSSHEAYGASTLTGDHVKVEGNKVTFDFPGKHGVQQTHIVNDPVIANMMKNVKPHEKIFSVSDLKVRDEWKKHGGEKVHDIRSYVATETAKAALMTFIPPKPTTNKEMATLRLKVAAIAAKKLGNRPEESLATYINPRIFEVAA